MSRDHLLCRICSTEVPLPPQFRRVKTAACPSCAHEGLDKIVTLRLFKEPLVDSFDWSWRTNVFGFCFYFLMICFYGNRFLLPRSCENKWVAVTKVLSSCGSDYVNVWNSVLSICCDSRLAKISTMLFLSLGDQRWQAFKDVGVANPWSTRKVVAIPLVYHRAYSAPLPSSHRFPMGWWYLDLVIAMGLEVCCDPASQRS